VGPERQPPRGVSEQGERPQEQRWRDLRGRSRLVALVLALSGIAAAAGTGAEGPGGGGGGQGRIDVGAGIIEVDVHLVNVHGGEIGSGGRRGTLAGSAVPRYSVVWQRHLFLVCCGKFHVLTVSPGQFCLDN